MKMSAYNEMVSHAVKYNNLGLLKAHEAMVNDFPQVHDSLIETAIMNARGMYMRYLNHELNGLLANSEEYLQLEKTLFETVSKIGQLHVEFAKMHNLDCSQSNETLMCLTGHLSTNLFNNSPYSQNC